MYKTKSKFHIQIIYLPTQTSHLHLLNEEQTNEAKVQNANLTKVAKTSGYSSMLSVERVGSRLGSSVQNVFQSLYGSKDLGYSKIYYESSMHNKVDCLHDDSGLGLVSITSS